jgi:PAS domain S-box-containing protein
LQRRAALYYTEIVPLRRCVRCRRLADEGLSMDTQTLEVNYHAMLAHSPDPGVLLDLDQGKLVDANAKAEQLWGLTREQLLSGDLAALCPPLQPDGRPSSELFRDRIERVLGGDSDMFEADFQHAGGRHIPCEVRLVLLPTPGQRLMHVRIVDITRRAMAERLRAGQARVLELVARGAPLSETLDSLMLLIESQSEGGYCSVMLLDDDGRTVHPASGPSLPPDYMAALDGLTIGPAAGSCGTAIYRKQAVIVSDIMHDPLWAPYRKLVEPYGFRACWSTPIYLEQQQVLGSFAMYYRELRSPSADEMGLIAVATHLAGIAMERTRRERELAQHREHLEELVAARTAELTEALDTLSLAQEELVRRDKLAALGALVAGVAHKLNTPIGNSLVVASAIGERARELAASLAQGIRRSTLDSYLDEAEQASELLMRSLQRAAGLVASFKQLAADDSGSQRRSFALARLIEELAAPLQIVARQRGVSLELALDLAPEMTMDSYPGPLAQALTELFENCLAHAFGEGSGGRVQISAAPAAPGRVAVSVEDNGAGIAPELTARVYDPFFTTAPGSGGPGLGLHVVHNIVTGILGGRIELHSTVGQGCRFTLLLPVAAPQLPGAD